MEKSESCRMVLGAVCTECMGSASGMLPLSFTQRGSGFGPFFPFNATMSRGSLLSPTH